jgi:hypothetical protein
MIVILLAIIALGFLGLQIFSPSLIDKILPSKENVGLEFLVGFFICIFIAVLIMGVYSLTYYKNLEHFILTEKATISVDSYEDIVNTKHLLKSSLAKVDEINELVSDDKYYIQIYRGTPRHLISFWGVNIFKTLSILEYHVKFDEESQITLK